MKMRIALLSGLLTLAAGTALAIPTTTIPTDQDTPLRTDFGLSPDLFALGLPETTSEVPLQLSQQVPFPCKDDPFGPIFIVFRPGPTTGPFDPTSCIPWPWPLPF